MFAKADKPDDTSDQLSVVSLDVFGLPSHNFNCTSKNNKRTVTVSVMTYREGGKKEAGHNRQRVQAKWKVEARKKNNQENKTRKESTHHKFL